jgi:hypothetical protein
MKNIRLFIRKILSENENILGPNPMEDNVYMSSPKSVKKMFSGVYMNSEICILKENSTGKLFYFYHGNLTPESLGEYMELPEDNLGPDEEGFMQTELIYDNAQITEHVIADYVSDNYNDLTKGSTVEDFENGIDIIEINQETRNAIISTWSEDQELASVLSR